MNALTEENIVVPATAQQLDAIHAALDRFWSNVAITAPRPPDGKWRAQFATAVAEIAANIILHAYRGGRELGSMRLQLYAYPDQVEGYFSDQGDALISLPLVEDEPESDLMQLPESGRGLAIARAYLDELTYRRTAAETNEWRLMKRLAG